LFLPGAAFLFAKIALAARLAAIFFFVAAIGMMRLMLRLQTF